MSYVLEIASGGPTHEFAASDDYDAQQQALATLADLGYDDPVVAEDWTGDGTNDDGQRCERLLFWADESAAENDSGAAAIAQLTVVRD